MKTAEEIIDKYKLAGSSTHITVSKALHEFAKQQAIEFVRWLNNYEHVGTPDELYELFTNKK